MRPQTPTPQPDNAPAARVHRTMDGALSARSAHNQLGQRAIVLPPYTEPESALRPAGPLPHAAPKPKARRRRRPWLAIGLVVLAVGIFGAGGWLFVTTLATNHQAVTQLKQLTQSSSPAAGTAAAADIPDEAPITPKVYTAYTVPADSPRYLRIPKFGVKARVVQLGILRNGELATPKSIWDVGWYTGSSKPGTAGAELLAGHYSGPTQPGAFAKVSQLKAGDAVAVERGDGTVLNYRVVKVETLPDSQVSMATALVSVDPGKKGLNLITCAGQYSFKTNNYSERTVVYTVQI